MTAIKDLIAETNGDPLEILLELEGYYECPKDEHGVRLGPLVGYAGKYDAAGIQKQYVGDAYINFAVADQYPLIMKEFGWQLTLKMPQDIDVFCGPQMGGVIIATMCALARGKKFACIEKEVIQLATDRLREQSRLAFLRNSILPGSRVVIVEDVVNNFSTTKECIALVEKHGGVVVGIGALLNRADGLPDEYIYNGEPITIFSLVKKQIDQWKQEDPEVVSDIMRGNVVLKPKNKWSILAKAMAEGRP